MWSVPPAPHDLFAGKPLEELSAVSVGRGTLWLSVYTTLDNRRMFRDRGWAIPFLLGDDEFVSGSLKLIVGGAVAGLGNIQDTLVADRGPMPAFRGMQPSQGTRSAKLGRSWLSRGSHSEER